MAEFILPTEQEFAEISRRTADRMKQQLLAVSARYDRRSERIMVELNNGAVVGFPRLALPGLGHATPQELRRIDVQAGGYGLHVAALDADLSVPALLEDCLGSAVMRVARARADAARRNGRLGGRPKKTRAA